MQPQSQLQPQFHWKLDDFCFSFISVSIVVQKCFFSHSSLYVDKRYFFFFYQKVTSHNGFVWAHSFFFSIDRFYSPVLSNYLFLSNGNEQALKSRNIKKCVCKSIQFENMKCDVRFIQFKICVNNSFTLSNSWKK